MADIELKKLRTGTKRAWPSICKCGFEGKIWCWSYDLPPDCPTCGCSAELVDTRATNTVMIATDDIPGGIEIRHGLVDPITGEPRKFYSKSEIKRAANEYGLKIMGDTPGVPYQVRWDGVRKRRKDEAFSKMDEQ